MARGKMSGRTKKQHTVPRFYLRHFTQADGELWTHDCLSNSVRKTTPEKTAFETNIYTPVGEDGSRIELIEDALAKIESEAALIYPDLLAFRSLPHDAKAIFACFLGTMFARSPTQLRQFAQAMGQTAGKLVMEREFREKEKNGGLTGADVAVQDLLHNNDLYRMDVDRRVGLVSFQQAETLAQLMTRMAWNYEISDRQQIVTSDNPMFWVRGSGGPRSGIEPYGFGLANRCAVIPFPISPNVILRLDWNSPIAWTKLPLERKRAKLANQYQAKHKERLLFFRDLDQGFAALGMKYMNTIKQIDIGVPGPQIDVVRRL